jgi:hypothetical protein
MTMLGTAETSNSFDRPRDLGGRLNAATESLDPFTP